MVRVDRANPDGRRRTPRRARTAAALSACAAALLAITGCAGDVPLEPAPNANDPACADVIVRLPADIGELAKRGTNAQSTGAWGDPDAVILRCGITPSGPTTDTCVSVDGIDWIIDDSQKPNYRFEAYGRNPGLEVIVDSRKTSGTEALLELAQVVELLPQQRRCLAPTDSIDGAAG